MTEIRTPRITTNSEALPSFVKRFVNLETSSRAYPNLRNHCVAAETYHEGIPPSDDYRVGMIPVHQLSDDGHFLLFPDVARGVHKIMLLSRGVSVLVRARRAHGAILPRVTRVLPSRTLSTNQQTMFHY